MELPPSAWIHTGTGCLYGPPFVSRCLLYRLYDIKLTLLIHHEPTISSATNPKSETGVMAFDTVVRRPEAISVHRAPSLEISLNELSKMPAISLKINNTSPWHGSLDGISLKIEPFQLPVRDMYILGNECGRNFEHQITNTACCVQSSARIAALGTGFKNAYRCWKVSLFSSDTKASYDFYSARDWDLTSLSIEEDWKPILEIRLVKVKGQC